MSQSESGATFALILTLEEMELLRYALTARLHQADGSVRSLLARVTDALESYESPTDV